MASSFASNSAAMLLLTRSFADIMNYKPIPEEGESDRQEGRKKYEKKR